MIDKIKEINIYTNKIKEIHKDIIELLNKDVSELDEYFNVEWIFKPGEDETATLFYVDRVAYACFKIEMFKYDIFFNNKTNRFVLMYQTTAFIGERYEAFEDYENLWEYFAESIKEILPDKYNAFIRMKKLNRIIND